MVQRMGGKLFVTCDSIEVRGDASISVNSTTKYRRRDLLLKLDFQVQNQNSERKSVW